MAAVGIEGETEEVTLMSAVRQTGVGKIAALVGPEIKNRDGLVRLCLLSAVAVIQQRSVVAVRAERNGRGKTVHRADAAG